MTFTEKKWALRKAFYKVNSWLNLEKDYIVLSYVDPRVHFLLFYSKIANNLEQPYCLSTDEWITKLKWNTIPI